MKLLKLCISYKKYLFLIKFKKVLDKLKYLCYNNIVGS